IQRGGGVSPEQAADGRTSLVVTQDARDLFAMIDLPATLRPLVERFDPSGFDAPAGEARIRLVVDGEGEWDVLADPATWHDIAADLRGGMEAYRSGRLVVRHNLHLGVGFLAATSGATGPGRL